MKPQNIWPSPRPKHFTLMICEGQSGLSKKYLVSEVEGGGPRVERGTANSEDGIHSKSCALCLSLPSCCELVISRPRYFILRLRYKALKYTAFCLYGFGRMFSVMYMVFAYMGNYRRTKPIYLKPSVVLPTDACVSVIGKGWGRINLLN